MATTSKQPVALITIPTQGIHHFQTTSVRYGQNCQVDESQRSKKELISVREIVHNS